MEAKTHENLKYALWVLDAKNDTLMAFIKMLITDIEKYKTLSDRIFGRLERNALTTKATDEHKKIFIDQVLLIKNNLGAVYLDRILKRTEHQVTEVVIAVENKVAQ